MSVLSAVIGVFFCECVCLGTRPPLNWACRSLCARVGVRACVSASHTLLTFSHSLFSFPSYFPSLMSSSSSSILPPSPPTGTVCIPARRGGGVCDPGSIRTRPPLRAALTPSLGKWLLPPWQSTSSSLSALPAVTAGT